ncbi:tonB-dependent receptor [alpha proteobacterium U9-1i]|nr:tonB-dependent receptor [alpha proteobacterium U9-1i]
MDFQSDPEIVVTAPRLPEAPGQLAFSSLPIDEAELTEAIRIDDALRSTPGVSLFRRNDSAAANPTIQGLSLRASAPSGAGRTLVLLDGQPLNDPFGGWVIWGAIPPDTLGRAEIVRGAGAGPYGAGALLGVVRLDERDTDGVVFSGEGGDLGHWRASAFGAASGGGASLMLAAQAQHEDGWLPVRARRGAADEAVWFDGASAVARLGLRGDDLAFSARIGAYEEERGAGLVGAQSRNTGQSVSFALARPNGPLAWRVQTWAAWSNLANSSVATAPDRSATTPANNQYRTPALGWGLNAALRWTGDASGVEVGADVRGNDGETRELFRFQGGGFTRSRIAGGEMLTSGAYAEGWRETGAYLVSGGVRLDQWRAFGGARLERDTANNAIVLGATPEDNDVLAPTARLGVRRGLDGGLYLRGAAYAGFRPPTLNELHRPFRVGNDITEANPGLDPERLTGIDAAVGGERWSIGVFATRVEGAIVNVTLGAGPGTFFAAELPPGIFVPAGGAFRQRRNAGGIDAYGVEAEAHGDLRDLLRWRAALNYTDAAMQGGALDGLRPAQSPEWSATAGLAWEAPTGTTFSADISYESARFEDDLNSRELAPATTVDLRVDQRLTQELSIYAAFDNVTDEAVETAETADGVESFGPPRAFRVGVRLSR